MGKDTVVLRCAPLSRFILLLLGAAAFADEPPSIQPTVPSQLRFLVPGTFRAGEVTVEPGSNWLAVVPQRDRGYLIEEATLDVEAVHDPVDDREGETTGLRLTAPSCFRTPLFMVRGTEAVQTGFMDSAVWIPLELVIDEPMPITTNTNRHYALVVDCGSVPAPSLGEVIECPLVVHFELAHQVLASFLISFGPDLQPEFADDAQPLLVWAGDIDRDRGLDLLLDLSNSRSISAPTLFLSSSAAEGELVGEFGGLETHAVPGPHYRRHPYRR